MTKAQRVMIALGIVPDGARLLVPLYDEDATNPMEALYRKGVWHAITNGRRDLSVDVSSSWQQHRLGRHWLYGTPDTNLVVIVSREHYNMKEKIQ